VDALRVYLRPTLEANRREFVGQTGRVTGFGAGQDYPQIWIRDSATLIPATRYHYGRALLESWLEEHLSHQRPDGQLWDWVAAGEPSAFTGTAPRAGQVFRAGTVVVSADKNTTAADQEASAVAAAGQIARLTGDAGWLRKRVAGRALVDRLENALDWVARTKVDPRSGLVRSAFTADWGDVSPVWPDQRAIYLDEQTPVVAGLYVSVSFAHACEVLAELLVQAGEPERARRWREDGRRTADAVRRRLWMPQRGFFRVHLGNREAGLADDADVFALGGNALAIEYGIADDDQVRRILAVAERRRREHGLSTVAGVLLPPYPEGFFKHVMLRGRYTYQNGGQWDWWAGRLLLGAFARGHSEEAFTQLQRIARRVAASGGLYECHRRDDAGEWSAQYAGSAGSLSAALFQGLFGLDSRADGLAVSVRLGARSGALDLTEPALGRRIRYRYVHDAAAGRARLRFEADAPGPGTLRVLLPPGRAVRRALLDGAEVVAVREAVGRDVYAVVRSAWRSHELERELDDERSARGRPAGR
jgi:hypothetical protein